MPTDNGSGCYEDKGLFPSRPSPSQHDPEQPLQGGQSSPRTFGMEYQQLLTQGEIFKDEILVGTESSNNPTKKLPKPHHHGKNLNETLPTEPIPKSLILRMSDVLMTHMR
jgi:hypothetical protein